MNIVNDLHGKWNSLLNNPATVGREEYNMTTSELRNSVRSIEWDLEDLEETIQIVEGNQRKFNLSVEEIESRKTFVRQTKQNLDEIKASINSPASQAKVQSSNRQVCIEWILLIVKNIFQLSRCSYLMLQHAMSWD